MILDWLILASIALAAYGLGRVHEQCIQTRRRAALRRVVLPGDRVIPLRRRRR